MSASANMSVKKRVGLYPGTFDPVTLGHLDIIKRAVKLVDHLVIGVATNASKGPMFSLAERVEMVKSEAERLAEGRATIAVVAIRKACWCSLRGERGRLGHHPRPARGVGL